MFCSSGRISAQILDMSPDVWYVLVYCPWLHNRVPLSTCCPLPQCKWLQSHRLTPVRGPFVKYVLSTIFLVYILGTKKQVSSHQVVVILDMLITGCFDACPTCSIVTLIWKHVRYKWRWRILWTVLSGGPPPPVSRTHWYSPSSCGLTSSSSRVEPDTRRTGNIENMVQHKLVFIYYYRNSL